MSEAVLATRDLRRSFTQADVTIEVLRGVDLDVKAGEIVALLGPSGSGKSTLLQAVGLLEGGFSGSIRLNGQEAAQLNDEGRTNLRRDLLGFVYQFHHLLPEFNALENVVLPQLVRGTDMTKAQQRVAVARALANKPPLVLADEPTGNLDEHTADIVFAEFLGLVRGEGSAALVATHNERIAAKMNRVLRLHEGRLE